MTPTPWTWPNSVVTHVVDGDTFTAHVTRDLGFGGSCSFDVRLRLAGINTPPAHTDAGAKATAAAVSLLQVSGAVLITTLGEYKYGGPDDSPGEWMATVTLADGRDVATELVKQGVAVPWDGNGPRPGG